MGVHLCVCVCVWGGGGGGGGGGGVAEQPGLDMDAKLVNLEANADQLADIVGKMEISFKLALVGPPCHQY